MTTTVERKYALTKVGPGDWLLPSNDAKTIWRIRQYEDGPSSGLTDWPKDITLWAVWRWVGRDRTKLDPDEYDQWEHFDSSYTTRREAIDAALRQEGEP